MKQIETSNTFEQEADCCGGDMPNTLKVFTQNGGASDDDIYLAIETERWAVDIDNIDELVGMLNRVAESIKAKDVQP